MSVTDLPAVNATLNSIATIFIAAGWWFILHEQKRAHIACMISALVVSAIFLACYLVYHFAVGSIPFTAEGWPRVVYFPILISHIILAMAIVPMVLMTVVPAIRQRFDKHKKWGRWTMPTWLYVSVTGVLVYLMLYVWFPSEQLTAVQ